ncbi:PadR family transcriptional regulator [Nocardioides sp. Root1257]|uniref:bifunctional helix-turn-helix transcriptional regulator/GNAT family N-acetyltransferase n=1 Tax=unclassified Nocardioides TaxID=2615069 RepID=UPI0006FB210C|nr:MULTISPECIES: helix-turn-helix domain-containing GNAT family N-acetyltransferase [unclassified Nocardioides]KQW49353.1 PadR family transcriptional regulator [Nocardioides sp. Root1257]KRC48527.1 PadR family transcriptional regulator [Nocardioides sp. Root224]
MTSGDIDTLRRFNRTYTQRIGALDESFLGTGRPLGVSRLLFEIGPAGAGVRELRDRLGLDSGYLTRLLRRLGEEGLVEVTADPTDGRRRVTTLTDAGLDSWRELDDRSEALARELVAPLTERQRGRLVDALATADLLVRAATIRLREVAPTDPAAIDAAGRYFAELDRRFPRGFDPGEPDHAGTFLLATSDGRPVAYGGVREIGPGTGEIKRMWVHEDWRGAGLGSRMLRELEALAVRLGHDRVVLDTNGTLTEAIEMYGRAGYHPIERYNDNPYAEAWFEKPL